MQPATHAGRIERQRGLHQHDRQRRADQRAQCEIAAREMHRRVDEAARELRHGGGKAAFENLFERVDSQRPVAEEEDGDIALGEHGIEREATLRDSEPDELAMPGDREEEEVEENGRASGRERGWQYVEISVVAG